MVWKPAKTLGLAVGLIIVLTIVGIDAFFIHSMIGQRLDFNLYVTALLFVLSLPLLALWIYWYHGLASLNYYLDRNSLIITCGMLRHIVPMQQIQRIAPGNEFTPLSGFRGVGWPGYLMGRIRVRGLGTLIVHSTEPLPRQLVVVTDTLAYGISPKDTTQFLEDYARRRALGPIEKPTQTTEYAPFAALTVWRDRWFWLFIVLSFMANAALFGWIINRYARLPALIPLHFNAFGEADRIAAKSGLLVIPIIGVLTMVVNNLLGLILHQRERLGAYLLVAATLGVQVILWLAALSILGV